MVKSFVFLIIFMYSAECSSRTERKKCSAQDTRTIYQECVLDYRDMTLWCDQTKLTRLPQPENIKSQAPCSKSSYLYMNDSCVDNLDPDVLNMYTRLEKISFSDNFINVVRNRTLYRQSQLKEFDLSANQIEVIEPEALSGARDLTVLKLTNNRLSFIDPAVFNNMENLEELLLDQNHFRVIDRAWFSNLHKLRRISLQGNKLSDLPEDLFENSSMIQSIDLRDNSIDSLQDKHFRNLCHLKELLISGNKLRSIHPGMVANVLRNSPTFPDNLQFATYGHVFVSTNNKWNCDCDVLEYWRFLKDLKKNEKYSSSGTPASFDVDCDYPKKLLGKKLSSLSSKDVCIDKNIRVKILQDLKMLSSFSVSSSFVRKNPTVKYITQTCQETRVTDASSYHNSFEISTTSVTTSSIYSATKSSLNAETNKLDEEDYDSLDTNTYTIVIIGSGVILIILLGVVALYVGYVRKTKPNKIEKLDEKSEKNKTQTSRCEHITNNLPNDETNEGENDNDVSKDLLITTTEITTSKLHAALKSNEQTNLTLEQKSDLLINRSKWEELPKRGHTPDIYETSHLSNSSEILNINSIHAMGEEWPSENSKPENFV